MHKHFNCVVFIRSRSSKSIGPDEVEPGMSYWPNLATRDVGRPTCPDRWRVRVKVSEGCEFSMTFAERYAAAHYADVVRWYLRKREILPSRRAIRYNFPYGVTPFNETLDVGTYLRKFADAYLQCIDDDIQPTNKNMKGLLK